MSTALQNIERAKGAAAARRVILAEIRGILTFYGKDADAALVHLIQRIKARERAAR